MLSRKTRLLACPMSYSLHSMRAMFLCRCLASAGFVVFLLGMSLLAGGCGALRGGPTSEAETLPQIRQLTRGFTDATDGVFSPDMRWIAFRAVPRGQETPQLYLARLLRRGMGDEGEIIGIGQPIRVTPEGSRNASPAFSPDGNTLIFTSTAGAQTDPLAGGRRSLNFDRMAELYRVDGWQRNLAAADPRRGVNFARHALAPNPGFDGEAIYSPDGRFILFASDRAAPVSALETHGLVDLYAMRPDGTNVARLTYAQGYDGAPTISPDGRTVFFHSDRNEAGRYDIYALDLVLGPDGQVMRSENVRRITADRSSQRPSFHPEGNVVAYVSGRDDRRQVGNEEIRQMRPDGDRDVRLTFNPAADGAPQFSPDGRYLLFSSSRTPDGSRQLFVARYGRP